jgi:hypothetical protein
LSGGFEEMSNNKMKILTERQKAVLETIRIRLTEKEALQYLSTYGFEMSDTTWYREKNKLEKMKLERLYYIILLNLVLISNI